VARFVINEPLVSPEPVIVVDPGLAVGRHRFRLQVVGSAGRLSPPDEAIVEVQRTVIPPIGPIPRVEPPVVNSMPGPTPAGSSPIGSAPVDGPRRRGPEE
jgi:hypothetical protein